MIDKKMLNEWLEKVNALDKKSDKMWAKAEKYEAEGNLEQAAFYNNLSNECDCLIEGMEKALNIFGYESIFQDNVRKIVEY
ncbi:MAG: hypothetical protein LIO87_02620 [Eubacterium sp.]|nr:hypothetical protein [Eubacterium sp.]